MKKYIGMLCIVIVASVAMIGCGGSPASKVESSFASAEPSLKESAQKAVDAVKAGNYAGAAAQLQALAGNAKLTPAQQQAIQELIADVQKQIQAKAAQAMEGAQKAMGDLQKKLGGK
jgi:outer membrane protein assembly factor BamD (BamD/ComL family)